LKGEHIIILFVKVLNVYCIIIKLNYVKEITLLTINAQTRPSTLTILSWICIWMVFFQKWVFTFRQGNYVPGPVYLTW